MALKGLERYEEAFYAMKWAVLKNFRDFCRESFNLDDSSSECQKQMIDLESKRDLLKVVPYLGLNW